MTQYSTRLLAAALTIGALSGPAIAAVMTVVVANNGFSTTVLKIKVGSDVKFVNSGTTLHNAYSVSAIDPFDLGSLQAGQAKIRTFSHVGKVEVECVLHQGEKMTITVIA